MDFQTWLLNQAPAIVILCVIAGVQYRETIRLRKVIELHLTVIADLKVNVQKLTDLGNSQAARIERLERAADLAAASIPPKTTAPGT